LTYKHTFIALSMLWLSCALPAQNMNDMKLIENQNFTNPTYEKVRIVKFGISENHSFIVKNNPLTLSFSALLFCYQKWLSKQISADCLYSPSCSEYSKQLFKRYGVIGGLITTSDRLMRCDRISATTIPSISIDQHDGKVHETVDRYKLGK
jgi:uncharacterized protein